MPRSPVFSSFWCTLIVIISLREWILLLARKKIAELRETPPVWLPDYAVAESKPFGILSLLALAMALAKELSGEAHFERAQAAQICDCAGEERSKNTTQLGSGTVCARHRATVQRGQTLLLSRISVAKPSARL